MYLLTHWGSTDMDLGTSRPNQYQCVPTEASINPSLSHMKLFLQLKVCTSIFHDCYIEVTCLLSHLHLLRMGVCINDKYCIWRCEIGVDVTCNVAQTEGWCVRCVECDCHHGRRGADTFWLAMLRNAPTPVTCVARPSYSNCKFIHHTLCHLTLSVLSRFL